MLPAANTTWQLADFFSLLEAEEVQLKKLIAQKLGIRYGDTNQDKPFAEACGGIQPYTTDRIAKSRATYHAVLHNELLRGDVRTITLERHCNVSLIVSGCLVKWKPLQVVNDGYVVRWMRVNVAKWDSSTDRLAALSDNPLSIGTQWFRLCSDLEVYHCCSHSGRDPRTSAVCTS